MYISKRPEYDKLQHSETSSTIRYHNWLCEVLSSELFKWLLFEAALGLIIAAGLESAIVYLLKEKLSTPRPIYYAMQKWASIYPAERQGYLAQASRSFPSGHAGSAAAVFGYNILLLVQDSKSWCRASSVQMQLAWTTIFLQLIFIFYVGGTRIKDYWHFSGDVIGRF